METLVRVGLINSLLATLLALLVAAVCLVCRRPAMRHALWLLVLLKFITPPVFPVTIAWIETQRSTPTMAFESLPSVTEEKTEWSASSETPSRAQSITDAVVTSASVEESSTSVAVSSAPSTSWWQMLAILWLAGVAAWFVVAVVRLVRFRHLLSCAVHAPEPVIAATQNMARRLGLSRCPEVWLVPAPISPMLWVWFGRPRLLLPTELWERLDRTQQDTVLAHELAHLRRRDHWVRWLEAIVSGLYWWHPVVWFVRRELREAEEQCCDAWAVWAVPGSAESYAATLLEVIAFLSHARLPLPITASGVGQVRHFKRRLSMIVSGTASRSLGIAGRLAILGLGVLLLPLLPSWAQQPRGSRTPDSGDVRREPPRGGFESSDPGPGAPGGRSGMHLSAGGPLAEQMRDAQEEIELLHAQLSARGAEVQAARLIVKQAEQQHARQEQLVKAGTLRQEEAEQARTAIAIQEAALRTKEAQLKETELRVRQAERRFKAMHDQIQSIEGRFPGGLAAPGIFQRPGDGEGSPIRRPGMRPGMPGESHDPRELATRFMELERTVNQLRAEVDALRQELHKGQPRPQGGASGGERGATR